MNAPPAALLPALLATLLLAGACTASGGAARPGPLPAPALVPGIVRYEAAARVEPAAGSVAARFRLSFLADEGTADSVAFVLNRGLHVHEVSGPAVRGHRSAPSPVTDAWTQVVVELDGSVAAGDPVMLEVAYGGVPVLPEGGIGSISPAWVELNLDAMWQPVLATFDRRMEGVLRLELPDSWTVVGSGTVELAEGAYLLRSTVLLPDVPFVAAPALERVEADGFTVYFRGDGEADARRVLAAAAACAGYLNREFGGTRPLPPGRMVLVDRRDGGYARTDYIVLSDVSGDEPSLRQFLCHELAHFWSTTASFTSPEHWMSEGFAEYVSGRVVREQLGAEAFARVVARWEEPGHGVGPVWTPEGTRRPGGAAMYRRAPAILHRLEGRIGAEAFARFLHRYMVEEVRTTARLLEILREEAGDEAVRWFVAELGRGAEGEAGR